MTQPAHTSLMEQTDVFIKNLAVYVDGKLATATKMYVYPRTSLTVNSNGDVVVTFPGVVKPLWGAVLCGAAGSVSGQVEYLPPVPPATIGRLLPNAPYLVVNLEMNPAGQPLGTVWAHVTKRPTVLTPAPNGTPQWYGTQPVKSGTPITISGIAWGPA